MKDEKLRITAKGLICTILMENNVKDSMNITVKVWNALYEMGCEEIGDTGLPALVIRPSEGGDFIGVVQES